MARNTDSNKYLLYLQDTVCDNHYSASDYQNLFKKLYETEFYALLDMDENRLVDAVEFRACYRNLYSGADLNGPISVLEVMVALAVRCEDCIMGNYIYGNRTSKWFWYMIQSMGLLEYDDYNFNPDEVDDILRKMLNREYEPDGYGGLFYIENSINDLRDVDIWYQMNWWLNTIDE